MGGAVGCLFSKFVLMFVWFIMRVMMGFRGGYYYYLPNEVGGGVATGVSNRYVGIGVVTYTDLCRIDGEPIYGGFVMGGQRRMRKTMLHLTTGHRSFGSFHGLILFMSIWMCPWKIRGDKYRWGINWQVTSELETLLDVGGCEGKPCILCHPAEVKDGVTPPHVFIQP